MRNMEEPSIGQRVRALREQRGFTLRELGRRAGVSASYLSRLEDGYTNPKLTELKLVASALEVPLAVVTGEEISDEMTKRINAHPTLAGRVGALLDVYEGADETRRTLIETIMDSVAQLAPQSHYNANNDTYFYSRQLVSA
jgi:transcriptional regulator with XRE-family HTH domain